LQRAQEVQSAKFDAEEAAVLMATGHVAKLRRDLSG
jgi:hypothetical protein